jgi:hypothetical protein
MQPGQVSQLSTIVPFGQIFVDKPQTQFGQKPDWQTTASFGQIF